MTDIKSIDAHAGGSAGKPYKTTLFSSPRLLLGLNCLEPGQVQSLHTHEGQDKFYLVHSGEGQFRIGDREMSGRAGDVVWAPEGLPHGVVNTGTTRLVLVVGIAPAP